MSWNFCPLWMKHDFWAKISSRAKIGGARRFPPTPPLFWQGLSKVTLIKVNPIKFTDLSPKEWLASENEFCSILIANYVLKFVKLTKWRIFAWKTVCFLMILANLSIEKWLVFENVFYKTFYHTFCNEEEHALVRLFIPIELFYRDIDFKFFEVKFFSLQKLVHKM